MISECGLGNKLTAYVNPSPTLTCYELQKEVTGLQFV